MDTLLSLSKLCKTFPGNPKPVVDQLSLTIAPGELFVLLGPSGCGKTTTLRMIAGFEQPDSGSIHLNEQPLFSSTQHLPPNQRNLGFVFQDYALFPHLNVEQNVGYGCTKWSHKETTSRVDELLSLVELSHTKTRMPHQLSGGEQQRIALARALAREPSMLLMDEPFSNLDEQRREQMRQDTKALLKQRGIAAILVTHHQEEALVMADRIGVMQAGHLLQVGTPEMMYRQPEHAFVASFMGPTNFIPAVAKGTVASTPCGDIPLATPHTGKTTLSWRPEEIELVQAPDKQRNHPEGTVISRHFKGNHDVYLVKCGELELSVWDQSRSSFAPGAKVILKARQPAHQVEKQPGR